MATLSDRYNERPYRKLEMAGLRKRVLELEQQVEQLQEMMPINTALLARNGELERQLAEHHTRVQHPMEMGKWVQQEDWEALVKERNQLKGELAKAEGNQANTARLLKDVTANRDYLLKKHVDKPAEPLSIRSPRIQTGESSISVLRDELDRRGQMMLALTEGQEKLRLQLAASQEAVEKWKQIVDMQADTLVGLVQQVSQMRGALVASRPYVNVRVETMIDAALALDTGKVADRMSRLEAVGESARQLMAIDTRVANLGAGLRAYNAMAKALQDLEEGEKDG